MIQTQLINIPQVQALQESLSEISNALGTVLRQVGSVNISSLQTTVDNVSGILTNMTNILSLKVDKTTTINNKSLNGNVMISKQDVGLGNLTNDSQLKRNSNDFSSFPQHPSTSSNDLMLLEDVSLGGSKYTTKLSGLPLSSAVINELNKKADRVNISAVSIGGPSKSVNLSCNDQGQIILASDIPINISPTQANLSHVQNVDTTNLANSFVRSTFVPLNAQIVTGDSCLNALQKLQGQVSYNSNVMVGADSVRDGMKSLVPTPSSNKSLSFLRGDGVWTNPTKNVAYVSSSINPAVPYTIYLADTSSASFTITLPKGSSRGSSITFIDVNNTFDKYPLILQPTGNDNVTTNVISDRITTAYYNNGTWIVDTQLRSVSAFPVTTTNVSGVAIIKNIATTLVNVNEILLSSAEWYDIRIDHRYTSAILGDDYSLSLRLVLLDADTDTVLDEVKKTFTVLSSLGESIYEDTSMYRLYPTVNTKIRVDAQILSSVMTSVSGYGYSASLSITRFC